MNIALSIIFTLWLISFIMSQFHEVKRLPEAWGTDVIVQIYPYGGQWNRPKNIHGARMKGMRPLVTGIWTHEQHAKWRNNHNIELPKEATGLTYD